MIIEPLSPLTPGRYREPMSNRLWHQDIIVNLCRIDSDTRTLSWTYVDHYIPHTAFKHTHNWSNAIFSVSKRVCIDFLRKIVKKQ